MLITWLSWDAEQQFNDNVIIFLKKTRVSTTEQCKFKIQNNVQQEEAL